MMHEEDDWPRRGASRRSRPVKRHGPPRERHIEGPPEPFDDEEEIQIHERGGPWGGRHHGPPPFMAFGPGPGRGKRFWMGEEPRRRPRVRRGDVRAAALALLAEEPRNGYQIIQEIASRSGGVWQPSPGSVYPALQQLEDESLISAVTMEGGRSGFALTEEGRSYIAEHADEVNAPWEVVAGREHGSVREMRGLIGQLAMAAMQVTQAGSDAQIAEAQGILKNTRRSLYRILAADDDTGEAGQGEPARGADAARDERD
ncbi:MAG TPA: PadR family transcriptional regulator [Streptosporangiaceae bacterium]|jgi:DNA-binding PadR family transcriptional regulator